MAWHLFSKSNQELQLGIISNLMSNFLSHLRQIGPSRQARRVDLFFLQRRFPTQEYSRARHNLQLSKSVFCRLILHSQKHYSIRYRNAWNVTIFNLVTLYLHQKIIFLSQKYYFNNFIKNNSGYLKHGILRIKILIQCGNWSKWDVLKPAFKDCMTVPGKILPVRWKHSGGLFPGGS